MTAIVALSWKIRIHLLLLALSIFTTGGLFLGQSRWLPYGSAAPAVLMASILLGVVPLTLFIRLQHLSRAVSSPQRLKLPVTAIPQEAGKTYLGQAFPWKPAHIERLQELSLRSIELTREAVDKAEGNWLLHGVGLEALGDFFLPNDLFLQHALLLGSTGSGKTRLIELLIEQAVARGDAVALIDPKGDERLMDVAWDAAVRHGRVDRWRLFALPYPFQSVTYNPVANYARPSEIPDRISLVLPKGSGDAEAFRSFAWEFVHSVAAGLDALGETITINKLRDYCLHQRTELVRRLLDHFCPDPGSKGRYDDVIDRYWAYARTHGVSYPELEAMIEMAGRDPNYYDKLSSALRPLFAKLTTKGVGYLLCPGEVPPPDDIQIDSPPPEISWESIHRNSQIAYFNLGSLIGRDTATGVARMALADLQSHIGKLYAYDDAETLRKRRLTVIVDEASDVLSGEATNLLNKGRGAGLSIFVSAQSVADLEVALEDRAEARRALANLGTIVCLRSANPEDAKYFSDRCGPRPLRVKTDGDMYEPALFSSGSKVVDDFKFRSSTSLSTKSEPLVPPWALTELPPFHSFINSAGRIYKAQIPFLDPPRNRISDTLKRSGSAFAA